MAIGVGSLVIENTLMASIVGSLVIEATVLATSFGGPITKPSTLRGWAIHFGGLFGKFYLSY